MRTSQCLTLDILSPPVKQELVQRTGITQTVRGSLYHLCVTRRSPSFGCVRSESQNLTVGNQEQIFSIVTGLLASFKDAQFQQKQSKNSSDLLL